MDLDPLTETILFGLVALLPFLLLMLWRKHIPGLRGMVERNTAPPFRPWTAKPHPDASVPVQTGSRTASGTDDPSHATVILRTTWGNYPGRGEGPGWKQARPLTPVVYVDGLPASSGWGTTRLTLTPGPHLIAVAGSHSRCYQRLDLQRGERRELDYRCVLGGNAHEYAEGFPGLRHGTYLVTRSRGLRGGNRLARVLYGAIGLSLLLFLVIFLLPDDFPISTEALIYLPALIVPGAAGLGIAIAAIMQGFNANRPTVAAPPPLGSPHELRILDADDPEKLTPAPGWAALSLRLRFWLDPYEPEALTALAGGKPNLMQQWRIKRVGEPELPAVRPWVPSPEVTVNGRPVDAGWTRSWMQLPPGEYDVRVRIPAPARAGPETRLDLSRAEWRHRVILTAGQTREVDLLANIAAVPHRDRPELAAFSVRL